MACFYMSPMALEICIPQRATKHITNVLETLTKPGCLSQTCCETRLKIVTGTYSFHIYFEIMKREGMLFLLRSK